MMTRTSASLGIAATAALVLVAQGASAAPVHAENQMCLINLIAQENCGKVEVNARILNTINQHCFVVSVPGLTDVEHCFVNYDATVTAFNWVISGHAKGTLTGQCTRTDERDFGFGGTSFTLGCTQEFETPFATCRDVSGTIEGTFTPLGPPVVIATASLIHCFD